MGVIGSLLRLGFSNWIVSEYLVSVAGEYAPDIVECCAKGGSAREIGARIGIRPSKTRKILNRLYEEGLVSYSRHLDKTNIYIYTWKLRPENLREGLEKYLEEMISKVESELSEQKDALFFECGLGCEKLSYEDAMEHDFRCPVCGGVLDNVDNTVFVNDLKQRKHDLKNSAPKPVLRKIMRAVA